MQNSYDPKNYAPSNTAPKNYTPDYNANNNYNSIYTFTPQTTISTSNSETLSNAPYPSITERCLTYASYAGIALTFPVSLPFCLKHVSTEETAVTSRAGGSLKQHQESGYILTIPYLDTFEKFPKNTIEFAIQPLKTFTKDSWQLVIKGRAGYRINEPLKLVRATQEGRDGLIKECTNGVIKSVCRRYNYSRIEDVGLLRNEVLLEVNRYSMQNWGIQLVTDEMSLTLDVIKRGEDGPGDPMVQIVKLVKEHFETSTQSTSSLPPGLSQLSGLGDLANIPGIEHLKNLEIPEPTEIFPQYQLLVEISKYSARKAEASFKKLNSTTFKITLKDYPEFCFVVDGTDFEKPVKIESDDYKSLEVDVFIGIKSTDIPKLLECRYDALKVWMQGAIEISGTNDVNKAVGVGNFLKNLME